MIQIIKCVNKYTQTKQSSGAHCAYPASQRNCGTWVVLPLPVSPHTMTTGCSEIASMITCSSPRIGSFRRAAWRWGHMGDNQDCIHTDKAVYLVQKGRSKALTVECFHILHNIFVFFPSNERPGPNLLSMKKTTSNMDNHSQLWIYVEFYFD